ncbi:MAG: WD40/YVTN/BNR-like repeat-containing protein [Candidatus Omnitrophota bacterium]
MRNRYDRYHRYVRMPLLWAVLLWSAFFILGELDAASTSDYLNALKWRNIGPYRGGRVLAVTGHPVKRNVFYFGGAGSGVWKTEDSGQTWKNISDGFFKTSSVGAMAMAPSSPEVLYVGMGEACLRGDISHGDGVYKTTDGGKTWAPVGLADTRHISRIRVHPRNADIVYVAALGHAFGPSRDRGIFRSTDGGKTWEKILFRNDKTGAADVILAPDHPDTVYAAFWEVQRFPYGFISGGAGSALYKSTDGGNTWKEITGNPGLPSGIKGRIGLAMSDAKPNRLWAIIEAEAGKSGIYRSEDNGDTWALISTQADLLQRPFYYSHIEADHQNGDTVYVMNVEAWKSADGGKTFEKMHTPHGDNHALWIDANDPMRMINGNDGGATVSLDGGKTWSSILNQPTAQFYHATTDHRFPYRVYGAQQDNETLSVPSRSDKGAITLEECYGVGGCESGYIAVHPKNPDVVYAGCYCGTLTRYDRKLNRLWDISVWPDYSIGWGAKELKYRFQWTFPILLSPHDPGILYTAGNHVFRSTTDGRSWETLSPDLTRNDTSKMESAGGPLTKDNTSVEYYGTIFSLAESPIQKGLFWAGSDDGLIHVSTDNGKTWEQVTPKNIPEWALISIIEPSHYDPGTAYVAATRYKLDDYRPYLLMTQDYGKTWKIITTGIPANDFTRVIREDPNRKGILYAGTESGVYVSTTAGTHWQSLNLNLPVTPIHDLIIHDNDLIAATHGRSFWILDDLTLLYQAVDLKPETAMYLFKPTRTIRAAGLYNDKPVNAGESLNYGVIVRYYLKEKPGDKDPVSLSFFDAKGNCLRTYTQKPERKDDPPVSANPGINRFEWDLAYEASRELDGCVLWGPPSLAPYAIPGIHKVKLRVGKQELEADFEIVSDPNLSISAEEYEQQLGFLIRVRDKLTRAHDIAIEIRNIRKQLQWYQDQTRKESYFEKIEKASAAIEGKLKPIEDILVQHHAKAIEDLLHYPIQLNNKLLLLGIGSEIAEGAPTRQALDAFEDMSKRVDAQDRTFRQIVETDVNAFNRLIRELNVPAIMTH